MESETTLRLTQRNRKAVVLNTRQLRWNRADFASLNFFQEFRDFLFSCRDLKRSGKKYKPQRKRSFQFTLCKQQFTMKSIHDSFAVKSLLRVITSLMLARCRQSSLGSFRCRRKGERGRRVRLRQSTLARSSVYALRWQGANSSFLRRQRAFR